MGLYGNAVTGIFRRANIGAALSVPACTGPRKDINATAEGYGRDREALSNWWDKPWAVDADEGKQRKLDLEVKVLIAQKHDILRTQQVRLFQIK